MKLVLLIFITALSAYSKERYEVKCNHVLLELSERISFAQLGITETGKNRGEVLKYHQLMNISPGEPYCAAGIYYCFALAADSLQISRSEIPISKSSLANKIYIVAKSKGVKTKFQVKKHDLIVWKRGKSKYGHIERVIEVKKAGNVRTIGFNVKSPDNPSIEGVFIRRRNIYSFLSGMHIRGLIGFAYVQH